MRLEIEVARNSLNPYCGRAQDRLTDVVRLWLDRCYGLFMVLDLAWDSQMLSLMVLQHWCHLYNNQPRTTNTFNNYLFTGQDQHSYLTALRGPEYLVERVHDPVFSSSE
jgi:hypothetical protein